MVSEGIEKDMDCGEVRSRIERVTINFLEIIAIQIVSNESCRLLHTRLYKYNMSECGTGTEMEWWSIEILQIYSGGKMLVVTV
jgi:hypothetical protein